MEATLRIAPALRSSGCDIIELGIPFSDPLADGSTIQRASYYALKSGITPKLCLDIAHKLRRKIDIPLVFMSYYNPILSFGLRDFSQACAQAGIDGLIIPDLPPEEGEKLEEVLKEQGLDLIYLLAPTSPDERIDLVVERSQGFIYLVSLTGVTGARGTLPPELESFVNRVRQRTTKPLCVGFGISTPEQARRVAKVADGVIVGSRIIQLMDDPEVISKVCSLVQGLRDALSPSI
jgi:tryptophan synthase alpha chain